MTDCMCIPCRDERAEATICDTWYSDPCGMIRKCQSDRYHVGDHCDIYGRWPA